MDISALESITQLPLAIQPQPTASLNPSEFSSLLVAGVGSVNESLLSASAAFEALALQKPVSTHEVMLTMEKAKAELGLAVEVRDKLLESYQELMRMQV